MLDESDNRYEQILKKLPEYALYAALATGMIVLSEYLYDDKSPVWLDGLIVFTIFGIALTVSVLNDKKNISLLELVRISNSIPKGEANPTTVVEFLEASHEEALVSGDKVTILTNELENYDLFQTTLQIIADNLTEGVVYEYYLPLDHEARLWDQVKKFCSQLLEKSNTTAIRNLYINRVKGPLIYNYAIVEKSGIKKGYWYQSTKPMDGDAELLIIEIKGSEGSHLENFFSQLRFKNIPLRELIFPEEK